MGILSQHEGRIRTESFGGSGTTFQIELPVADGIDTLASTNDPDAVLTTVGSTNHVPVVDDEPDLRARLARQLELQRYTVDQAGDGEEAWRKL